MSLRKETLKFKKIIFKKIEIVVKHSAIAEDTSLLLVLQSQSTNPDHLSCRKKMVRICN